MSKDWYARKLGQQSPAAPPATQGQQSYPTQQQAFTPQQQQRVEANAGEEALARGDYAAATAHWQGGQATRTETENCPSCGSANYFSHLQGAGTNLIGHQGAARVAGRCFDCNHNGMYDLRG
jgi:hypothetical protein